MRIDASPSGAERRIVSRRLNRAGPAGSSTRATTSETMMLSVTEPAQTATATATGPSPAAATAIEAATCTAVTRVSIRTSCLVRRVMIRNVRAGLSPLNNMLGARTSSTSPRSVERPALTASATSTRASTADHAVATSYAARSIGLCNPGSATASRLSM